MTVNFSPIIVADDENTRAIGQQWGVVRERGEWMDSSELRARRKLLDRIVKLYYIIAIIFAWV